MKLDRTACLDWCYPNLLENITRGVVAEYLVACALGLDGTPRVEWDSVDLRYPRGTIEVKSAAYLQSWTQKKFSAIQFDIAKRTNFWNSATGKSETLTTPQRVADLYVFCLLAEKDQRRVDPLDPDQWIFYPLRRQTIDDVFANQKTVALSRVEKVAVPTAFAALTEAIDKFL